MTEGTPVRIGIVGLGKIVADQHVPAITGNPAFVLHGTASRRGVRLPGVPHACRRIEDLLALPDLDAVAICTPPEPRFDLARKALEAGKHVLMEKPPTTGVGALDALGELAAERGRVLFTTWHSQYNAATNRARELLAGRTVTRLHVTWKEDVRVWHPGQAWIWQAGGFGVFDPGINALSILTGILPDPIHVTGAELSIPANFQAPIAATLTFAGGPADADLRAEFDWRQTGPQSWDIDLETADGLTLTLRAGGSRLEQNGELIIEREPAEYQAIYDHFATLLREGRSYVDAAPLTLVADAFLLGRRVMVEPFE